MKRSIFIFCLLSAMLTSCLEREVEVTFGIPKASPRLVLNSVISANAEIRAHISLTGSGMTSYDEFALRKDATVRVYINDVPKGIMIRDDDPMDSVSIPGYYRLPEVLPVASDKVRLEVDYEGVPSVSAETTIPKLVEISSIDTVRYTIKTGWYNDRRLRVYANIKDDPTGDNYYIVVMKSIYKGMEYTIWSSYSNGYYFLYGPDGSTSNFSSFIYYDDPAFSANPGFGANNSQGFANNIFTDKLFNGKEYLLKFSFSPYYYYYEEDEREMPAEVDYQVSIISLSRSYYDFINKFTDFGITIGGIHFSRPYLSSYTNVENGFGIVSASSEYRHTIRFSTTDEFFDPYW